MSNPRPLFKQSAETVCVAKLLAAASPGDIVTYDAMRQEIRTPIDDDRLRSAIGSARKVMIRDYQVVFDVVPTVGYQRLTPAEVIAASDRDVRGIKRKAITANCKLATVDAGQISAAEQTKLAMRMAVFGVVAGQFDGKLIKRLGDPEERRKADIRNMLADG